MREKWGQQRKVRLTKEGEVAKEGEIDKKR